MDRQATIDFLLDHYETPRNHGPLDPADVVMPGGNPDCDDVVTLYLRIDPATGVVTQMTFEGQGCTISQAAASVLTEMVQGLPLTAVDALDVDAMLDKLGREVVRSRPRCAMLTLNTLKHAVAHYRNEQRRAALGKGENEVARVP